MVILTSLLALAAVVMLLTVTRKDARDEQLKPIRVRVEDMRQPRRRR